MNTDSILPYGHIAEPDSSFLGGGVGTLTSEPLQTDVVREAIAEAKRHESHTSNCDYQCWTIRTQMVPLVAALAAAEKRAKGAEAYRNEFVSQAKRMIEEYNEDYNEMGRLTRKLATAHQYIREVCPLLAQHTNDVVLAAYAERGRGIVATIDALAGGRE